MSHVAEKTVDTFQAVGAHCPSHIAQSPSFENASQNKIGVAFPVEPVDVDVPEQPLDLSWNAHVMKYSIR